MSKQDSLGGVARIRVAWAGRGCWEWLVDPLGALAALIVFLFSIFVFVCALYTYV